MNQDRPVRVRVAPSPTGDPHVGLAYISLFNYVFAKKNNGKFILRLEDTDQNRARSSSDQMILSSLKWLGFKWDEGPDCGGPFAPYRQSERTAIYQEHAKKLIDKGAAYRCFCSSERLEQVRQEKRASGQIPKYDGFCRHLPAQESLSRSQGKEPFVVRLKMPTSGQIIFRDELRGEITIDAQQLDDQVLIKSDGFPTYHLANVVDDYLMQITHVIRAEEWIASTPKHVVLYDAFGWDKPQFIHMPLLRNLDKSKISKRKNPTSLNYYKRKGILPKALLNFLALMGWSYDGQQEIFSVEQMIEAFELNQISLGSPVFDLVKLTAINQSYIQMMSADEFVKKLREEVFSEEYLKAIYPLVINRVGAFEQFVEKNSFFFTGALSFDLQSILPKGKDAKDVRQMIGELLEKWDELYTWEHGILHQMMEDHRLAIGWKPKDYFMTIRLVTTGRSDSPPLAETLEVIGKEMVRFRLRDAYQRLG